MPYKILNFHDSFNIFNFIFKTQTTFPLYLISFPTQFISNNEKNQIKIQRLNEIARKKVK